MRTLTFRLAFAALAGLAAATISPLAASQQTAPQQPGQASPSDKPPVLEKLEEGEEPAITIRKEQGARVKEKREGGRVTEAEVTSGGSTYTVRPVDQQPGNAQPGDAQAMQSRPAQWKVMEFDLSGKIKNTAEPEGGRAETPAPPAEPAPAAK